MIRVRIVGIDGTDWTIEGMVESLGAVLMEEVSGLVADISRSTQARGTGRGVTVSGHSWPAMEGTLKVVIRPWDRRSLGTWYDMFTRSWSTTRDSELWVMDSRNHWWSTPARLSREFAEPVPSPWKPGLDFLKVDVPIFARDGIYSGEKLRFTPDDEGVIKLHNPGTMTAFPLVKWSGAGQSVTTPYGVTVRLPTVSEPRLLSTDPGTNFVVTDEAGYRDNDTWRAFRGLTVFGETAAGARDVWHGTDNVALEMIPMSENPWR